MGILRVDHPDVLRFIDCKQDTGKITNFNISIAITDEFMGKLKSGDGEATKIWDKICHNAWRTGEPGLFFVDEANRHNPVPHLGEYEATNPCGEQPLLPYDVCNLGSLNLSKYVDVAPGDGVDWKYRIDWEAMVEHIKLSTRFLDNVIDANQYPLEKITNLSQQIRRIGNGVMGFADLLIKLRVPYDSREALDVADYIADFFVRACRGMSEQLAGERGTYPANEHPDENPQRNCNVTTVAPTGTISIIAGCSGGIEPIFAVGFYRNQAGMNVLDIHPDFTGDIRKDFNFSDEEINEMALGRLPIPKPINWYRTSGDVPPEQHVRMQAAWQKHICSAISKTINMPANSKVGDVAGAYKLAYDLRCKGVTVYRDGCRPGQVLSTKKTEDGSLRERDGTGQVAPVEKDSKQVGRPVILDGRTRGITSPIGKMYVTVNHHSGKPYEVFVAVGKAGGTSASYSEALGRLISLGLRRGIGLDEIHRQLRGISSDRAFGFGDGRVASGPDAVAIALEDYLTGEVAKGNDVEFAACPDCHSELHFEEGCYKCHSCGYGGC
jgi:ribonucleoside-diphosphate reductase alpha chain